MTDTPRANRDWVRRWLIGTALLAGAGATLGGGAALLDARQAATPLVGSPVAVALTALPVVPDPAGCVLPPLSYDDLAIAVAEGAATPAPAADPANEPAGPLQVEGIVLTLFTQIACVNAGDLPRALALTGGGYLAQVIGPVGLPTEDQYAVLATPVPLSIEGSVALIAVDDVIGHPDGTVSARVVTGTGDVTTTSSVTLGPSMASPTGWVITDQVRLSRVNAEDTPVA